MYRYTGFGKYMIASFIKRYQEILQEATPLRFPHRGVGPRAGVRAYGSEGAPVHNEKKKGVRCRFGARAGDGESLGAPPPPSGRSDQKRWPSLLGHLRRRPEEAI